MFSITTGWKATTVSARGNWSSKGLYFCDQNTARLRVRGRTSRNRLAGRRITVQEILTSENINAWGYFSWYLHKHPQKRTKYIMLGRSFTRFCGYLCGPMATNLFFRAPYNFSSFILRVRCFRVFSHLSLTLFQALCFRGGAGRHHSLHTWVLTQVTI